ncbi:MAG TPA: HepT-like ribonuclease domain-containing protein [Anaerolineales bacterium]|nr:HepT-like ribonuclease domain-containing protein [Anaerolineales bacterium]
MSKRDPAIALQQILTHAKEAVDICQGKSRADLDRNRLLNLALTRLIEIIGEAANRVPEDIQTQHPNLPWLQMIGARNRLIHGYDNVDFDILWAIINNDLPILIAQLEEILETE